MIQQGDSQKGQLVSWSTGRGGEEVYLCRRCNALLFNQSALCHHQSKAPLQVYTLFTPAPKREGRGVANVVLVDHRRGGSRSRMTIDDPFQEPKVVCGVFGAPHHDMQGQYERYKRVEAVLQALQTASLLGDVHPVPEVC